MSLITDIAGLPKHPSIKSRVEQDVENTLSQLALQQSNVDLSGAASFETEETQKTVSVTVKPVLRSMDVETGDDVSVVAQRLVGGEVKFTVKF